jgi:hypothetical protein
MWVCTICNKPIISMNNLVTSSTIIIPWNILMAFILKLRDPTPFHEWYTYLNFLNWHLESKGNEDLHPTSIWGNSPYVHLGSLVRHLCQNNKIFVNFHVFKTPCSTYYTRLVRGITLYKWPPKSLIHVICKVQSSLIPPLNIEHGLYYNLPS